MSALCAVFWMCAPVLRAQAAKGSGAITGMVFEAPTSDGLPEATVVISNDHLSITRTITTSDDGVFFAPDLPPGTGYDLKVTRRDFKDWEQKQIEVPVGQTLSFEIEMIAAGGPAQSSGKQSESGKFSVSEEVSAAGMASLPTSDRRVRSLVLLAPAVTENPNTGVVAFQGQPSTPALFTDGAYTTSTFYLDTPSIAPQLPQDALQGVQTLSAGAPADWGHSTGGMVNVATRSGTNDLHGQLYDYFNSQGWNAANRFAPGFHPSGSQNQAGAGVGGAILPRQLFGFANVEWIKGDSEGLNLINNPLISDASGTAVLGSNCAAPATAAQCAAASKYLNSQMNVVVPRSLYSLDGVAKLDWRPEELDSVSLDLGLLHRNAPNGVNMDQVSPNDGLLGQNGNFGEENRFGKVDWGRDIVSGLAYNNMSATFFQDRSSDYWNTSLLPSTGMLAVNIAGTAVGANPAYPLAQSEHRWEYADDLSVTSGSNKVKIGVGYVQREDWVDQLFASRGLYNFPSLTAFALDYTTSGSLRKDYTSFSQGFGNHVIDVNTPELNIYLEDTWQPLSRLTVTAGLRWEKPSLPAPLDTNSSYYQTAGIASPDRDFAPRVGLAYQLDNRTVVRAGFGLFFQPFPGQLIAALAGPGNAVYQEDISLNPTQSGALFFPAQLPNSSNVPSGATNVLYGSGKLRNPYSEEGTLSVERQLGASTTVSVSAIDSLSPRQWTVADQNMNPPTISRTYSIDDAAGNVVGTYSTLIFTQKANNAFAHAYIVQNEGSAYYRALAAQVKRRLSHGLSLGLSYTWSHAIDDVGGTSVSWLGSLPSSSYNGSYRADQADSAFDQRHRAAINWTWQPTVTRSNAPLARYLLNGWQVSGIATLAGGLPETALVQVNGQQFGGVTMAYTNSLNGSGGWSRVPFYGASSLRTQAEYDVDARLSRSIPVTERVTGTLMLEAFNVFNSQFNTALSTIAYTATAGVLRPVPGLGSGIAADGYPYGTNARRVQIALRISF